MSPIPYLTLAYLLAATWLALLRGGAWEKTISLALVGGWIVSALTPFDMVHPPWGAIVADTAVFLLLMYACLRSRRRWLVFAASFQFLILATHYGFATNLGLMQWAYVSAYYTWNIALITALLVGSIWREKKSL
nr:hypothetical protein [uncultured Brevundimonas sp.]